ncbi:Glu/Leu/Phe/Val family dehydrogenase [Bacillus massilinigeriensis]|uniref:Glu/Leu/Phe/Val family dehydrogenase n=1 Tax=Bacillus massilionigeriensis TaxID=1805475 RepID=UPI00096AFC08|nr:Glu/Leu/Phe/Val dehydrogenase dimerization domain-containing protein [Bacillus massilionigeriensis]
MDSYMVTLWKDPVTKVNGYFVIDRLIDGLAGGGIRMREGVTQEEVQRLAATMTIKMAGLGMPIGGAKGGINYSPSAPDALDVLKRYLEAHKAFLLHHWCTSEDLGTREEDIVRLLNEIGLSSSVDAYLQKSENGSEILQNLMKSLRLSVEEIPLTDIVTGYGVAITAIQALDSLNRKIKEAKVSIQGFGSVGASTAKYLYEAGAKVVAVSDVEGTIFNSDGLDIPLLQGLKDSKGTIDRSSLPEHYELKSHNFWLETPVDVLIPAAIADVINEKNVNQINTLLIVEAANIPVTEGAEKKLFERNIYCIPDFIANSGGAGLFGAILYKRIKPEVEDILQYLKGQIGETTKNIMSIALEDKITPREAANISLRNKFY